MLPYPEASVEAIMKALSEELDTLPVEAGSGIEQRVESMVKAIKNLESQAEGAKSEMARLSKRKSGLEGQIAWLKSCIMRELVAEGTRKIKTGFCTASIRKGLKRVEVMDEKKIPAEYFVQPEPRLDKTKIMEAFKNDGEIVAGTEITDGAESLSIR